MIFGTHKEWTQSCGRPSGRGTPLPFDYFSSGTGVRFSEIQFKHTKTIVARATGGPQKLSMACFGRKLCRDTFGGIGVRFYGILLKNTKTIIARATGRHRISRWHVSAGDCAAIRLKASVCGSRRFDLRTPKASSLEPQGVPEALEDGFRHGIVPRFV